MTDSHNFQYYLQCLFGGSLACGITHTAITTLDLLKCLKQVDPTKFKSFSQGFHQIYQQRGVKGLITGWSPTLIGYSQQGLFKYGLYEVFKDFYAKSAEDKLEQYKVLGYALSSASAELIADLFLCPWESVKVRMQTQVFGKFPGKLRPAMRQIYAEEGLKGFYKGLIPLWSRQIPYTVAKFVFFEEIISFFYGHVFNSRPKDQYSTSLQLMVTFTSGYLAGIICAIVSHPADTIMS